jgi:hypothetical protein
MRADTWPAYPPDICYPEMPSWAESRWLEREVEYEERRARPEDRDAGNLMAG